MNKQENKMDNKFKRLEVENNDVYVFQYSTELTLREVSAYFAEIKRVLPKGSKLIVIPNTSSIDKVNIEMLKTIRDLIDKTIQRIGREEQNNENN